MILYAHLYTQRVNLVFLHRKQWLFQFAILGLKESKENLANIFFEFRTTKLG